MHHETVMHHETFRGTAASLLLTALLAAIPSPAPAVDVDGFEFEALASGLASPVAITHAGDARLFITLQGGRVLIFNNGSLLQRPFLDISSRITSGNERGLLSIAFHPDYASNGFFYAYFTDRSGDVVIARYSVSADPNVADEASEAILLEIGQPFANHNGGQLQFGPDGFLYAGTGDGGSANDPNCDAQDTSGLLGKILRLDVDQNVDTSPFYGIPASNPFVGVADVPDEIWALGLRNPWRFSFDRASGDLYIGDVGQNQREEVDLQTASSTGGENYGWKMMEGFSCTNNTGGCGFSIPGCDAPEYTPPILDYSHQSGRCSITGGYVYRGATVTRAQGAYFYGDFCTGEVWAAENQGGTWTSDLLPEAIPFVTSFGEDRDGELYAVAGNTLYRLRDTAGGGCPFTVGDPRYCDECGPCGEGEGGCRGDDQCASGLVCAEDFGARFGLARAVDVCLTPRSLDPPPYTLTEVSGSGELTRVNAAGLNDRGQVVGTFESDAGDTVAFRVASGAEAELLDPQGQQNTRGLAINDAGDVFGLLMNGNGSAQTGFFVFTGGGGFDLLGQGADNRIRTTFRFEDMNSSADLAGSVIRGANRERPYLYTAEDGWIELTDVDSRFRRFSIRVALVNDRGDLVFHRPPSGSPAISETFLLRGSEVFEVGDFGQFDNTPRAVNRAGRTVGSSVSSDDKKPHAYVYSGPGGRLIDIHPPRFDSSDAVYVTAKGIVGGTIASADKTDTIFTWDNRRQRRMKLQARGPDFRRLLAPEGLTLDSIDTVRMNERLEFVGRLIATNNEVLFLRWFYYSPATGLVDVQDLLEAAGSDGIVFEVIDMNDWGAMLLLVDRGAEECVVVLTPDEN